MKKAIFLLSIALVLFACNSGNKDASPPATTENSEMATKPVDGKTYECLKEYQDHYDKLLTKEEMAAEFPINFEDAKVNLSSGSFGKHNYIWPSDRPDAEREISGMKMTLPDKNSMGVNSLSFYPEKSTLQSSLATFNRGYKKLTESELKQIEDNLEKADDDVKKAGKKLMKTRLKMKWDFVDGLGSSAWYQWNEDYGGKLAVLAGKAKFEINLKISNDPAQNLEIAKKLAQKVIDKCD